MKLLSGERPDITPPQLAAMVIAGIPIIAQLLRAFGIYDMSLVQQAALSDAVTWASVFGAALIGGDAILRVGRNLRRTPDSTTQVVNQATAPPPPPPPVNPATKLPPKV